KPRGLFHEHASTDIAEVRFATIGRRFTILDAAELYAVLRVVHTATGRAVAARSLVCRLNCLSDRGHNLVFGFLEIERSLSFCELSRIRFLSLVRADECTRHRLVHIDDFTGLINRPGNRLNYLYVHT